ncbi:hypothetical protein F7O44_12690 [Phytoactinopolyspora sp. XMNu-373]|uniref:PH regulation protein F n=1 Tax=Phytoactinopolyspora mesophila TaxID=2650750 RepID=A0A7K3M4S7_9ACTN|nr:hypothetical protein [Phytoactinopolyspora mesophila]
MYAVAVFLLLNVIVGLVRAIRGPSIHDRLIAFLLLGTTGVALLAVLASVADVPALRDAALALVSLAAVVVIVRVQAEDARR